MAMGVGIDTKSTLILRDIDILKRIAKQYPSIFKIHDYLCTRFLSKQIEPFAPVSSKRFETVKHYGKLAYLPVSS